MPVTAHLDRKRNKCKTGTECETTCINPEFVCRVSAGAAAQASADRVRKELKTLFPELGQAQRTAKKTASIKNIATSAISNADKIIAIAAIAAGIATSAYAYNRSRYRSGYDGSAEVARRVGEKIKVGDMGNYKQATFTVDGLTMGTKGNKIRDAMRGEDEYSDHKIESITGTEFRNTNRGKTAFDRAAEDAVFGAQGYLKSGLEGRSKMGEKLAAKAYAQWLAHPDAPINLVGSGSGGHVVQDAATILHRINPDASKKLKVVAINTPDIGMSDSVGIQKTLTGRNPLGLLPMRGKVTLDTRDKGDGVELAKSSYMKGLLKSDASESVFTDRKTGVRTRETSTGRQEQTRTKAGTDFNNTYNNTRSPNRPDLQRSRGGSRVPTTKELAERIAGGDLSVEAARRTYGSIAKRTMDDAEAISNLPVDVYNQYSSKLIPESLAVRAGKFNTTLQDTNEFNRVRRERANKLNIKNPGDSRVIQSTVAYMESQQKKTGDTPSNSAHGGKSDPARPRNAQPKAKNYSELAREIANGTVSAEGAREIYKDKIKSLDIDAAIAVKNLPRQMFQGATSGQMSPYVSRKIGKIWDAHENKKRYLDILDELAESENSHRSDPGLMSMALDLYEDGYTANKLDSARADAPSIALVAAISTATAAAGVGAGFALGRSQSTRGGSGKSKGKKCGEGWISAQLNCRKKGVGIEATDNLVLDPTRFQYKMGANEKGETGSLAGVKNWNPDLSGVINVWADPKDDKLYVVNGHNRTAKAKAVGAEEMKVSYIDVKTAKEARAVGALINIAEGNGTALDAAKFMRDTGKTPQDMIKTGIPMRNKVAADGMALSRLAPELFDKTVRGDLPVERATIIGDRLSKHQQQRDMVKLIDSEGKRGRKLTNDVIRELATDLRSAPVQKTMELNLFGSNETTRSLAIEKASLTANIRKRLAREKRLFGTVSKSKAAQDLSRGGNVINAEKSKGISETAGRTLSAFDQLRGKKGELSNLLNAAVGRIASGEKSKTVEKDIYEQIIQQLSRPNAA